MTARLEGLARGADIGAPVTSTSQPTGEARKVSDLGVGDLVLVKFKKTGKGKIRKLSPQQQGPYRVVSLHNDVATVERVDNAKDKLTRHVNDLTRFTGTPEEVAGDGEYEVEKIVQERVRGRRREYLVRWAGYGEDADLWLPESKLKGATKVLDQWKREKEDSTRAVPSLLHAVRVVEQQGEKYLIAADEDMGPEDYVWVTRDQVDNPTDLDKFISSRSWADIAAGELDTSHSAPRESAAAQGRASLTTASKGAKKGDSALTALVDPTATAVGPRKGTRVRKPKVHFDESVNSIGVGSRGGDRAVKVKEQEFIMVQSKRGKRRK